MRVENDGLEAALEEWSATGVASVEPNAVAHVEPLNGLTEVGLRSFEKQMVVIRHEHICVQMHAKSTHHFAEELAKVVVIALAIENAPPLNPSAGHMKPGTWTFDSRRSSHTAGAWMPLANRVNRKMHNA